jgi:hypothetical protein
MILDIIIYLLIGLILFFLFLDHEINLENIHQKKMDKMQKKFTDLNFEYLELAKDSELKEKELKEKIKNLEKIIEVKV